MQAESWKTLVDAYDERRDIYIPGNKVETIAFCVQHFLQVAQQAIAKNNRFTVALSGGSTPKAIYHALASEEYRHQIDWCKVHLFWSDERAVSPQNPESNFKMAMDAGFSLLPIPKENIFRMPAEGNIEEGARQYDAIVRERTFDLVMLGMGDDGHTASLFPRTHALHSQGLHVVGNYISKKNTWRMTFTFPCINGADNIVIYVLGKAKAEMVKKVLTGSYQPDDYPVQRIGTSEHKALWILDETSAQLL